MINKQRKPNKIMMTKKNYKQQQHFQQFYSIVLPVAAGSSNHAKKFMLYYRRHNPSLKSLENGEGLNLYNFLNNNTTENDSQKNKIQSLQKEFPKDRTLQVLTFDDNLNLQLGRKIFRKLGKIRKFINGQGIYKGRTIYYLLIVYKFQFDLVKAFRQQFLQSIINQQIKNLSNTNMKFSQQQLQQYRVRLIQDHLAQQQQIKQKMKKVQILQKDGYNIITDRFGNFKVDYQANKKFVENLPQMKNKNKKIQKEKRFKNQIRQRLLRQKQEQRDIQKKIVQDNEYNNEYRVQDQQQCGQQ